MQSKGPLNYRPTAEPTNDGAPLNTRSAKGTPHQMRECLRLTLFPLVRERLLAFSLAPSPLSAPSSLLGCPKPLPPSA